MCLLGHEQGFDNSYRCCRMGPEGQAYMRQKRQQAERAAAMAAQRVSWEEELRDARKQRVIPYSRSIARPLNFFAVTSERPPADDHDLLKERQGATYNAHHCQL